MESMERKQKVLHLLQSDRFSGAENVVCQIMGMFRNTPNMEMVYCSRDGQIREALAERNVPFVPIRTLTVTEVKRVLREQKPDIVHAHDMRASFVAALCCGKIPLISHVHNNSFASRGLSVKSIAYLLAARKAKHIFWVSKSACSGYAFGKWLKEKSSVLYNVIDIDALYQRIMEDSMEACYDVLYLGRLSAPKNPTRLMFVLEKVVQKLPDIKIGIVGTGELEEETKALCSALHLQNNVTFLGFQSNPLNILKDAKVMIMTSLWEGTPMCALEAMALGVPIVSTPTDGLCDLVSDGETGFLSDDDAVLAERILEIVKNEQLRTELSKASLKKIRKLMNREAYMSELVDKYTQV